MFPSRWEQLSFWETYWESPRSMSHSSQTWQLFLNLGPRRHFCICLVVINSTFSWALITCSHNHDSKHKGPTRDISVALLTFGLFLPTRLLNLKRNPCSCQFLHSLQDNTQECGYIFISINTGLPSFNSPPCPQYTASLLMLTVVSPPSVVCPILQHRQIIFPAVYSICAAITASKCLHNSPVSYQQKNKTEQNGIYKQSGWEFLVSSDTLTAGWQFQVRGWED